MFFMRTRSSGVGWTLSPWGRQLAQMPLTFWIAKTLIVTLVRSHKLFASAYAGALTMAAASVGAFAAFLTVLALIYSNRSGKAKDAALARVLKESSERVASLNLALEKQKEETAKAQLELDLAARPRYERFDREAFKAQIRGRPKMRIELLYPAEDTDSYLLAGVIAHCLKEEEWTVTTVRSVNEQDARPGYDKNGPLLFRAGVTGEGMAWTMKTLHHRTLDHPTHTLMNALNAARGSGRSWSPWIMTGEEDSSLPEDLIKLVVAPKFRSW